MVYTNCACYEAKKRESEGRKDTEHRKVAGGDLHCVSLFGSVIWWVWSSSDVVRGED